MGLPHTAFDAVCPRRRSCVQAAGPRTPACVRRHAGSTQVGHWGRLRVSGALARSSALWPRAARARSRLNGVGAEDGLRSWAYERPEDARP